MEYRDENIINKEECKRNLVETENFCKRFGKIFICENCKKYYAKVGSYIYEVEYDRTENRWKMVC